VTLRSRGGEYIIYRLIYSLESIGKRHVVAIMIIVIMIIVVAAPAAPVVVLLCPVVIWTFERC
jgi:hypothetical protein